MDFFQHENIFELFEPSFIKGMIVENFDKKVKSVNVWRNDDLDLCIDITTSGWSPHKERQRQPGTVYTATAEIFFEHIDGSKSVARGVINQGWSSSAGAGKSDETVWRYTAHSLELDLERANEPAFTIEWLSNIPTDDIWPGRTNFEGKDTYTHQIGDGKAAIHQIRESWSSGGTSSLHIKINEIDLYLMKSKTVDGNPQLGRIIYKGSYPEEVRKQVRLCLSFALGLPIVYYGCTNYCADWHPTSMTAFDAVSIGGAMFRLHALPPYPICQTQHSNIIDQSELNNIVNGLYVKYHELRFNEISWCYWYAVCAPIHTAAVHFGALIEQLQKSVIKLLGENSKGLLEDATWRLLSHAIRDQLNSIELSTEARPILENKIRALNQLPQSLALKRLLSRLGLRMGKAETDAWKHRNKAAHGLINEGAADEILNAKLLKIVFHRLLAAATRCSVRYVDYYNLEFPVRLVEEEVPIRNIRLS